MNRLNIIIARLRALFWRERVLQDTEEELRIHLEMEAEANIERGMQPSEAQTAARVSFGNRGRINDLAHEIRGGGWMDALLQDIRYGVRRIRKTPGVTGVVLLSLALGIGANTAILSLIEKAILRQLPVKNPGELVSLKAFIKLQEIQLTISEFSAQEFEHYKTQQSVFSGMTAYSPIEVRMGENEDLQKIRAQLVADNYFSFFGVPLLRGRDFSPEENRTPGAYPVAIISEVLWQTHFGGAPDIISRSIRLNGELYTIIGVAPAIFRGLNLDKPASVWTPMMMRDRLLNAPKEDQAFGRPDYSWLELIARIPRPAELEQSERAFNAIALPFRQSHQDEKMKNSPWSGEKMLLQASGRGLSNARDSMSTVLKFLGIISAFILLIACANVANLLLIKTTARTKEYSIRLSLGSSRWRLVRQALTESMLLSIGGGVLGAIFAPQVTALILSFQSRYELRGSDLLNGLDWRFAGVAFALSMATGLLCSLLPAWQASRTDLLTSLKTDSAAGSGHEGFRLLRRMLVTAQVAISLVVLICAGLFIRSLHKTLSVDKGFNDDRILLADLSLPEKRYDSVKARQIFEQTFALASALPGVEHAALARHTPLSGTIQFVNLDRIGKSSVQAAICTQIDATPGYFETLETKIKRGRSFTDADRDGTQPVVIVNEAFVREYLPQTPPLGEQIILVNQKAPLEIVGVSEDVKTIGLKATSDPLIFTPIWQAAKGFPTSLRLVLKTKADPQGVVTSLRDTVRGLDPELALFSSATMTQEINASIYEDRMAAALATLFGVIALVLAMVGLYGAIAYSVQRRMREIGVRMALGAMPSHIMRMIFKEGLWMTAAGLLIGCLIARLCVNWVESSLYGVKATDWRTWLTVCLFLAGIAALACWRPARRAANTDPQVVLHCE
jgi:macrolide transport system ATP-binding/permease protein